jgi:hypothetical protein
VFDRVLTFLMIAAAIALAVSVIRGRRVAYRDIKPSEINPELAAGEELLRDVLREGELSAQRARSPEFNSGR